MPGLVCNHPHKGAGLVTCSVMRARSLPTLLCVLLAVFLLPLAALAEKPTGLKLQCSPDQASVYIDGKVVAQTPETGDLTLPLSAGEHTLRVSRPGYAPFIDVIKVKAGQLLPLEVELIPIAGILRIAVQGAAAHVYLDGKYIGDTPTDFELKVGPHKVKIERPGAYAENLSIAAIAGQVISRNLTLRELPPDQNPYLQKPPPPQKWYQKWWVWTIGAVGVAVIATAIIVPVVLSRRDACDGLDGCIPITSQSAALSQPPAPALEVRF